VKNFCLVIGVMEEQKVAIKLCVKAGKSAVESIELINKAYGSAVMSRADVYRRYAGFREGREEVKDDARTDENVESVRRLLTEDRRTTLQVIADRLNFVKKTIRLIVTEDFGKRKICARFVPHALTTEQK
jgi:ABC-type molybdate transport system substrate-binding protein